MTHPAFEPSAAQADWLDALLATEADAASPADEAFSAAVLRALPPARRRGVPPLALQAVTLVAMAAAAALLAWTIPDALDFLAAGRAALQGMTPAEALQRLLPATAALAWLGWASLRHAMDD